ncbi:MAG TPA: hypothetical protein VFI06_08505 [Chitinophagaceae bacterium]|nr:hypothetical protein [Chitinophagaceae bacterium]
MRNYLYLLFFVILFSSCKKDQPVIGEKRLTIVTTFNASAPDYMDLQYNGSGRLTKLMNRQNGTLVATASFDYTGNEISITHPGEPVNLQQNTRYQLDGSQRPSKRIFSHFEDFTQPQGLGPEKHFGSDTTNYEYNASGFLFRSSGIAKDSISYYPSAGVLQNSTNTVTYSIVYEMEGGNLKSIKRTAVQNYFQVTQPGTSYSNQQTMEETIVFYYDKNYPNKFDFKNAFLLTEVEVLPFRLYTPNASFLNFPNKATTTRIIKNAGGNIISTNTNSEEVTLTFDNEGYIAGRYFDPQLRQTFSYSRF